MHPAAHRLAFALVGIVATSLLTPAAASAAPQKRVPEPGQVVTSVELADVDCVSRTVCFGVGTHHYREYYSVPWTPDVQVSVRDRPVVVTRTPSGWKEMDFPAVFKSAAEVSGISCVATGRTVTRATTYCVVNGRYFTWDPDGWDINEGGPLTAVWNGRRWRLDGRPLWGDLHSYDIRTSVQCTSNRTCYALGIVQTPRGSKQGLASWDGKDWTFKLVRKPVSASGRTALTCWADSRCVATGYRQGREQSSGLPLIQQLTRHKWTTYEARSAKSSMEAVDCLDGSLCVATGRNVSVVKKPGSQRWRVVPMLGNKTYFTSVSCPTTRSCLAVGANDDGPAAQTFDGRRWESATPLGRSGLLEVDCVSSTWCVAIGQQILQQWNGHSWRKVPVSIRPYPTPPA